MTYEAVFDSDGDEDGTAEIVLDGILTEVNLFTQAGNPKEAVTITFVLTGTCGGINQGSTAIKAGNFAEGSKIILILTDGFVGLSKGGNGGRGAGFSSDDIDEQPDIPDVLPENGFDGGVVYDAEGVDTDIYFSGDTPSSSYPEADGYIFAPNGGDAGGAYGANVGPRGATIRTGDGGNGGDGYFVGTGGLSGNNGTEFNIGEPGEDGNTPSGDSNLWGLPGNDNSHTIEHYHNGNFTAEGGAAGSGVIDSDAIVQFFGDDSNRYVNGNGDH